MLSNPSAKNRHSRYSPRVFRAGMLLLYVSIVVSIPLLAFHGYRELDRHLTQMTLERRLSIAHLAAYTLQQRLNALIELGLSLASRVRFARHVEAGEWQDAIGILESVPRDFPYLERLFLTDLTGTQMAATPHIAGVTGKNFAFREWFQGVSREWKPYVSGIYIRTASPEKSVIAVAIPVRNSLKEPRGILVLQVNPEAILQWCQEILPPESGYIFVTDARGRLISHPSLSPQSGIRDFSTVPAVKKALSGMRGVETAYNPIERVRNLAAYEPVPEYGWAVVAAQEEGAAYRLRNQTLRDFVRREAAVLAVIFILLLAMFRVFQALRTSRRRLQLLLETIPGGIWTANAEGMPTFVSAGLSSITGFREEELLLGGAALWHSRVPPDFVGRLQDAHEALRRGKPVEIEYPFERRNGALIWLLEKAIAVSRPVSEIHYEAVISDITSQKNAEATLIQEREALARAQAEMSQLQLFAFVASHDLQEPLHKIMTYTGMILQGGESLAPEVTQRLTVIDKAARRMSELIDASLNFSRITADPLPFNAVKLNAVLSSLIEDMAPRIAEAGAVVKVDPLPDISGDSTQVELLFRNLIHNALKFRRPDAPLQIHIWSEESAAGFVRIAVADNGIGFDEKYADRIFKPFQTLHRKGEYPGSGIGLAICQKIMMRHQGTITVRSISGKGSTFFLKFPTIK